MTSTKPSLPIQPEGTSSSSSSKTPSVNSSSEPQQQQQHTASTMATTTTSASNATPHFPPLPSTLPELVTDFVTVQSQRAEVYQAWKTATYAALSAPPGAADIALRDVISGTTAAFAEASARVRAIIGALEGMGLSELVSLLSSLQLAEKAKLESTAAGYMALAAKKAKTGKPLKLSSPNGPKPPSMEEGNEENEESHSHTHSHTHGSNGNEQHDDDDDDDDHSMDDPVARRQASMRIKALQEIDSEINETMALFRLEANAIMEDDA